MASLMLAAAAVGSGAEAAHQSEARLTPDEPTATWTGTVAAPTSAVARDLPCPTGTLGPTCDGFLLEVDSSPADDHPTRTSHVTISIDGGPDEQTSDGAELFVVAVHESGGRLIASGESTEDLQLPGVRDGRYVVSVRDAWTSGDGTYRGDAVLIGEGRPADEERECLEPVPAHAGHAGITDDGSLIALEVLVLLDDVALETASAVVEQAAAMYEPLGIEVAPFFDESLSLDDLVYDDETDPAPDLRTDDVMTAAKAHVGWAAPTGVDLVYAATTRDIDDGLLGFADCIGGVRWPERSFAIGEINADIVNQRGALLGLSEDPSAVILAHELGHLLGAHHHYATCDQVGEDDADALVDARYPSACTVMMTFGLWSDRFGPVSSSVIRGHAWAHARS